MGVGAFIGFHSQSPPYLAHYSQLSHLRLCSRPQLISYSFRYCIAEQLGAPVLQASGLSAL